MSEQFQDNDQTASSRKQDHIELAFRSKIESHQLDTRFYYEPLLAPHPKPGASDLALDFLGYRFKIPLWVSSMTGGTAMAGTINHNLARAAGEFGFGMGLGSCRSLLSSDEYLPDFDVRDLLGDNLPLYANLGLAQIEQLADSGRWHLIEALLAKLRADGLIVHINPLQEWLQPEGDRFEHPPLETLSRLLDALPDTPIIVKEVGQGMGPASLKALLQLPLAAIDFAAAGGTNFAKLELLRSQAERQAVYAALAQLGHTAEQMVGWTNAALAELGDKALCDQVIISGGIQDFLDGFSLINRLSLPAVYGQASALLQHARGDYEALQQYLQLQVEGLQLAKALLR